jgi:CheY-like chemotaxis protein
MGAIFELRADVLVSDLSMPGEDGYALVGRLRALGGDVGKIPAVALTALARTEDRERALAAGFQNYLPKPVDPAELATIVRGLVPPRATAAI